MVDLATNFKSIQRRIHNINYTKTHLVEGYEDTEENYRKLRDILCIYKSNLVDFVNYEHGGKTMKTIKEGLSTIGRRLKEDYFKNDSMFQQASIVLESMSQYCTKGDACRRYSEAMRDMEKAKCTFNERLEQAIVAIQRFEKDSQNIDSRRIEVKNKRYDLEKLMHKPGENQDIVSDMENRFNSLVQSVFASMKAFISDKGIEEIVCDVKKAHYEFNKTCYERMKNIQ
eukprot:jgi/Antlo1/1331/2166